MIGFPTRVEGGGTRDIGSSASAASVASSAVGVSSDGGTGLRGNDVADQEESHRSMSPERSRSQARRGRTLGNITRFRRSNASGTRTPRDDRSRSDAARSRPARRWFQSRDAPMHAESPSNRRTMRPNRASLQQASGGNPGSSVRDISNQGTSETPQSRRSREAPLPVWNFSSRENDVVESEVVFEASRFENPLFGNQPEG